MATNALTSPWPRDLRVVFVQLLQVLDGLGKGSVIALVEFAATHDLRIRPKRNSRILV